jgi:hypothetical protein
MKSYLTNQHRARIVAPGWDARILHWSPDGAAFQLHGRSCALVRQGNGFIPTLDRKPISDKPEYQDACLAIIWRAVHN